jgi:xanthine dehydrogenase accessory factor
MRELIEITAAARELIARGKPAALVTVVAVEGSAYRRPGARMLVAEDGRTWGGVSGGCLDRDAARRARGVAVTGVCQRHRYETGDDEALAAGVTTGCGGAVEVFLQPVNSSTPGPIPAFNTVVNQRKASTLSTILSGPLIGRCSPEPHPAFECFVETILPPHPLVVFGGGPDVVPLVSMAKTLGWHVTVVATRPATGLHERFAAADALHFTGADDPVDGVVIPPEAAVVVMTHNYARDLAILPRLPRTLAYLGLLGPRHRTARLVAGLPPDALYSNLYAPVGLDLGADAPEEIALSVMAEIQSVLRGATATHLRDRSGPIHAAEPRIVVPCPA